MLTIPLALIAASISGSQARINALVGRDDLKGQSLREALGTSEAQLLNALKIVRAGHWQYDILTDRITFNDQLYSILRTTAQAVGGYSISPAEFVRRFVHPEDAALVQKGIEDAIKSATLEHSGDLEYRVIFGDGNAGYMAARWFNIRDASGRAITVDGVNQDITERKQAEQTTQESEAQFRSLLGQQVAGIIILRDDGTLAYVNPRFAQLLGYEASDLIGRVAFEFVLERDKVMFMERVRARLSGQTGFSPIAYAIRCKDGAMIDVLGETALVTYQGRPALFGVIIDNSDRKRAERSMQQTVEALANTVEIRDPYTAGHQRHVAKLACSIGRDIGMSDFQIEGLQLASTVHDIGKINVPAEILNKPGKLTHLEFAIIQTHAQAGYDILKGIDFPWPVAQTVLQHHERLNGSGYPQGLIGDAVLLEAKVLAVADVVDSMMMHRPYRAAKGPEAALAEIERGKEVLYDPAAVDACLSLFRRKAFSFD
jgi:PAS domain S-box-containing protein